ncbi:MAG: glycosyltransferase family 4 protein [Ignavibacteriaceae bacterium]|nr:glycosyltransferase family 4 protein [Ignavibacteriaceae bacterium]
MIVAYALHLVGGTERSIINLANGLADENYEVILISLVNSGESTSFALHQNINLIRLNILGKFVSTFGRILALPGVLLSIRHNILKHKSDRVICFGEKMNILIVLSLLFNKTRLILSENYPPGIHYINPLWRLLRSLTYRKAWNITVLTPDDIDYFHKGVRNKVISIPNIINNPGRRKDLNFKSKVVIAIGRLDVVKRYDLLINAFSIVGKKYPDWKLEIWGEGPMKNELNEQIKKLDLESSVLLKGVTKDIYPELLRANFLVLSSQYESFGYVICEAMSVGIPVVSFDCPSGPRHIIRHNVDGLLIPFGDTEELANGIIKLIEEEGLRIEMGNKALDVLNRFSTKSIISEWSKLLSD